MTTWRDRAVVAEDSPRWVRLATPVSDDDAAEAAEYDHMLEFSRRKLRGSSVPDLREAAFSSGASVLSRAARLTGQDRRADWLNRFSQAYSQAMAEIDEEGAVPAIVRSSLRGAASQLPEMILESAVNPALAIAGAVSQEANQAITEGREVGMAGGELAGYAATQGTIEAVPEIVMQRMGLGGFESAVKRGVTGAVTGAAKQTMGQTGKRIAKDFGAELLTEIPTELGHSAAGEVAGTRPGAITDPRQVGQTLAQTALQTAFMMGPTTGAQVAQAAIDQQAEQREANRPALARIVADKVAAGEVPSRGEMRRLGFGSIWKASKRMTKATENLQALEDMANVTQGTMEEEGEAEDAQAVDSGMGVPGRGSDESGPSAPEVIPPPAPQASLPEDLVQQPPAETEAPVVAGQPSGREGIAKAEDVRAYLKSIGYTDEEADAKIAAWELEDARSASQPEGREAVAPAGEPVTDSSPPKADRAELRTAFSEAFAKAFAPKVESEATQAATAAPETPAVAASPVVAPVPAEETQPAASVSVNERVESNQGLVWREARRLARSNPGIDVDDLAQEGQIGLLNAAQGFDEGKGVQFSTYATRAIRNQMLATLKKEHRSHDLPSPGEKGEAYPMQDVERMEEAVKLLGEKDQKVLSGFYGLQGQDAVSLTEMAKQAGVTVGAMSARKDKAIKRLSFAMRKETTRKNLDAAVKRAGKAFRSVNMGVSGEQVLAAVELTRAAVDHGISVFSEYVDFLVSEVGEPKVREFSDYFETAWEQIRSVPGYEVLDEPGNAVDFLPEVSPPKPGPAPPASPIEPEEPKKSKPAGKPAGITSIKNRMIKSLRESRGRAEIGSVGLGHFEDWLTEASNRIESKPEWMPNLIVALSANPRAVDHIEHAGMQLHYREAYNRYGDAVEELEAARSSKDDTWIASAQAVADAIDVEMNTIEDVARKTGTIWGQSGNARKIELLKDFTFAGLSRAASAAKGGVKPTEAESAELKEMADRISKLEEALEESKAARRVDEAIIEALKQAEAEAKKKPKKSPAPAEQLEGKTAKEWGVAAIQQRARMLGIVVGSRKPDRLVQLINQVEDDIQTEANRIGADYRVYLELLKETAPDVISYAQREAELQEIVWDNNGIGKSGQEYGTRWALWQKKLASGRKDVDAFGLDDIAKAHQEEYSDIISERDLEGSLWELMQKEIPTNIYLNSKEVTDAASRRFTSNQDSWQEARPEDFGPLPWERQKSFFGESPKRREKAPRQKAESSASPVEKSPPPPKPPRKLTKAEQVEKDKAIARASIETFKEKFSAIFQMHAVADPKRDASKLVELTDAAAEVIRAHLALGLSNAALKVSSFSKFWANIHESLGESADEVKETFQAAWVKIRGEGGIDPPKVDPKDTAAIGRLARQLTRYVVGTGVIERETVVNAVWEDLKGVKPDITRREAMDAISGYGDFRELPKDTVSKQVRRIKGELQQLAKIEVLENAITKAKEWLAAGMSDGDVADRLVSEGLLPKKTGVERREVLDIESELIKQVNELKKKIPVSVEGGGKSLKTAMGAAKTAMRNQIKVLDKAIKGKAPLPGRAKGSTDPELEALRKQRDELRKEYDALFPRKPKSHKRTAEQREKAALKRIAQIEEQLRTRNFTEREKAPGGLRDDLQKKLDVANKRLRAARKAAKEADVSGWEGEGGGLGVKPPLSDALRLKRMIASLDKSITELEAALKAGRIGWRNEQLASDEVDAKRKELATLRRAQREMQDAADPAGAKKRDRTRRTKSLKRQLAEWRRRIKAGEFETKEKADPVLTKEQLDIKYEIDLERRKFEAMKGKWKRDRYTALEKVGDFGEQSTFLIKSLLSFADFMTGRQGAPSLFSNPVITAKTIVPMLKAAVPFSGERSLYETMERIKSDPDYTLAVRAGLPLSEEGMPVTSQEEAFAGRWSEKFPLTAWANRSSSAFLNKLRFELFKADLALLREQGPVSNEALRGVAKEIGVWTGRGGLWRFESAAHGVAAALFSARYFTSTFQVLTDPFTIPFRKEAGVRRTLARRYASAGLGLTLFLSLVKFAAWAFWDDDDEEKPDVSLDPRSSDFMKLKVGNTRFPLLGGIGPSAVFLTRVLYGQSKSSTSKLVYDLRGENVGPMQKVKMKDVIFDFGRSKLAPVPGQAVDWILGETMDVDDETGAKVPPSVARSIARLTLPISGNDVYDVFKEWGVPKGVAMSAIIMMGFGGATYGTDRQKVLGSVAEVIASSADPRKMDERDKVAIDRSVAAMQELGASYDEAAKALTYRLRKRGYSAETARKWRGRLRARLGEK